ncbi:MAG: V-type ATP synthase subunit F [Thermoanaerobaculia bacterium]
MNVFVIGTPADVRGFSLAGVRGFICETREAVEQRVGELLGVDPDAVLVFSSEAGDLISDRCARWRREASGPAFEILPR